jgi:hypothetical protein
MYIIFATFNGLTFIHMFSAAPETRGKTLEEMDEVFDSGLPTWKSVPKGSRLDQLAKDIEAGNIKITVPVGVVAVALVMEKTTGATTTDTTAIA